jgi:RNA polymerase sigma-70 factor (ECF subfamily)
METWRVVEQDPEADDIDLVRRAVAGDSGAFHGLVDRHADRLYRLAVSLVGNAADAEDVLQETFAGAYRGLKGFEERASVKTWLTRIVVVQVARWRRERSRRPIEAMPDLPHPQSGSAAMDARIDLAAALQKLSPEHQQVLVLREFEQMTYEEIAAVLDVPRGTVESRLHRARAELREKLKSYRP